MELKEIQTALEAANTGLGKIGGDLKGIDARMSALEAVAKARSGGFGGGDKKEGFSILKGIKGSLSGKWEGAEREQSVIKTLNSDDDSAGGFMVPIEQMPEVIELLRSMTVIRESGARVMSGLTGSPVTMPKQTGAATAYWVAQGSSITESQQTLGQVTMTPKQVAAMTALQRRLVMLANPSVEAFVREDLTAQIARAIDLAALYGTGGSNEPLGLKATLPAAQKFNATGAGAEITAEDLYTALQVIESGNAARGNLGWICHPKAMDRLRKLRSDSGAGAGTGDFLLQTVDRALAGAPANTLLGYPVRTSTQIPVNLGAGSTKTEIFFGNWQDLVIGEWGTLEIRASDQAGDSFAKNQMKIRAIAEVDVAVRIPESFVMIQNIETA